MRESMIIYRSFYDAIKELEPTHQAEVWKAVFEYGLNKKDIKLKGLPATIFTLIKPQLDANIRKYENGSKGGRPKKQKESKEKPKQNLKETKEEPNVNDNDNDNQNDTENKSFEEVWSAYGRVGNKQTSKGIWKKLKPKEREEIQKHIPRYINNHKSNDKLKYVPHFTTYLNQRRWEDELPYQEINNKFEIKNLATLDDD